MFKMTYDIDLESMPNSILVIPFVCNVLPIVWLTNAVLELESLDSDFYQAVEAIREGYQSVHPNLNFMKEEIKCRCEAHVCNGTKSLCFFSGGVDAFATLINHVDEQPVLFTIWGADIHYSDLTNWTNVYNQMLEAGNQFSLPNSFCRTNFRDCVNEFALCELVRDLGSEDDWWHGFQHGIGLIGHAAPLCYQLGIKRVYIASSYTIRERSLVTCASDPRIDNMVHFCGTNVFHDLFECNRQQKIHKIVDYVQTTHKKIRLRVCWQCFSATNCCKCEKCYRTICGLIAAGTDPRDYAFPISFFGFLRMKFFITYKMSLSYLLKPLWRDIQEDLNTNGKLLYNMNWLKKINF